MGIDAQPHVERSSGYRRTNSRQGRVITRGLRRPGNSCGLLFTPRVFRILSPVEQQSNPILRWLGRGLAKSRPGCLGEEDALVQNAVDFHAHHDALVLTPAVACNGRRTNALDSGLTTGPLSLFHSFLVLSLLISFSVYLSLCLSFSLLLLILLPFTNAFTYLTLYPKQSNS